MPRKLNKFSSSGRLRMAALSRGSVKARPPRKAKAFRVKGKGGYWGRLIGSKIGGLFGTKAAKVMGDLGDAAGEGFGYIAPIIAPEMAIASKIADVTGNIASKYGGKGDLPLGAAAAASIGLAAALRKQRLNKYNADQTAFKNELSRLTVDDVYDNDHEMATAISVANSPDQPLKYPMTTNDKSNFRSRAMRKHKNLFSVPAKRIANPLSDVKRIQTTGQGAYVTGKGAYVLNDTFLGQSAETVPTFHKSTDGTRVTITHSEYIKDISPSTAPFQLQDFVCNPGMTLTFPWLSGIASNFEEYQFKQLMFHYRSTVSDIGNSSSGQVGTLVMCPRYNVKALAFKDKMQMLAQDNAISGKLTDSMTCGIECDDKKIAGDQYKYVRGGDVVDEDLNDYDHARVSLAVCTPPAGYENKSVGELWVSYSVMLSKPLASTVRGETQRKDIYTNMANVTNVISTGVTKIAPLYVNQTGTGLTSGCTRGQANNLGTTVSSIDSGSTNYFTRIYMPSRSGIFRIRAHMRADSLVNMNITGLSVLVDGLSAPNQVFNYAFAANDVATGGIFAAQIGFNDGVTPNAAEYQSEFMLRWDSSANKYIDLWWSSAGVAAGSELTYNQQVEILQENPLFYTEDNRLKIVAIDGTTGIL